MASSRRSPARTPRQRVTPRPYAAGMLVGRPGMSPLMVGREAEIARLARLVDSAHSTAVALVGGEAGVGKTRLVRELLRLVPDDAVVLAGQADPGSLGRPFELFLDALDRAATDER